MAFTRNGSVVYHQSEFREYFDVDPVPGRPRTVEYVAARHLSGEDCPRGKRCTRNVVERVNLSTGATARVYAR